MTTWRASSLEQGLDHIGISFVGQVNSHMKNSSRGFPASVNKETVFKMLRTIAKGASTN
jgi:hypothetical protein